MKIKSFFEGKLKGATVSKDKKPVDIALLCLSAAYIVVLFATRYNFLAPISVALSAAVALVIFLNFLTKSHINLYFLLCYPVLLGGTALFLIIFSADGFAKGLGWNLLIALSAIVCSAGLVAALIFAKGELLRYVLAVTLSFCLIGSSVLYFLMMSMRVKPTVDRLWEGHDNYLASLTKTDSDSPNVLFILMDDLGYADLSAYSYDETAAINTPNIDAIGEDGILMENFYTTSPVCSPSRFSILTGRYQSRGYLDNVVFPTALSLDPYGSTRYVNPYQFKCNVDGILGDEITFAEALDGSGYNTACIGKWNLGDYGEYLPTNQGFDYFFGSYYVNDMTPYNIVRETGGVGEEIYSHKELLDQSGSTRLFTDEMKNFITNSVDSGEKFLAYYTTPWPHYPIFSGEVGNKSDDNYIDCVEEFDGAVGELVSLLKEKGVYDDTIIIFTSDNGPGREGATGALRGRKNTTFEGGHKVPMLVSYPAGGVGKGEKFAESNVITSVGSSLDFFPTILQYCGIKLPNDRVIDGVDLSRLWDGTYPSYSGMHGALFYTKKGNVQAIQAPVIIDGETKIFKYYEKVRSDNSAFIDQVFRNYLFDLSNDPIEAYNVSMVYPEVAEELLSELKAFRKELKDNPRGDLSKRSVICID